MAIMTLNELCELVAEYGGAMAGALSEVGDKFTKLVAAEGGQAVVTAERQAEILAQTMGRQILRAANECRLAAEIAGRNPAVAAFMNNIADAFTEKAIYLTQNAVNPEARIAIVAAEAQKDTSNCGFKMGRRFRLGGTSSRTHP